jgi:nucleoside 2-deoxyribosyltransferase
MRVYLCGPMTGLKRTDIEGWRDHVSSLLSPFAQVIDTAHSDYDESNAFQRHETISQAMLRLRHGRFVVDRNKNLIRQCDIVLANFLIARTRVSIGSVGELYWADEFGKPIIIVRDKHGNVHDHAMVNAIASEICHDLDTACRVLIKIAGIIVPMTPSRPT